MTAPMRRAPLLVLATALLLSSAACRDLAQQGASGLAAPSGVAPVVRVRTFDGTAEVTLALVVPSSMGRIRSYTGRVLFDSTALRLVEELPSSDGTMRAFNARGGLLRVAGVALAGIDASHLAVYRFTVLAPGGADRVEFALDELHDVAMNDLMPSVRRTIALRGGTR